MLAKPIGLIMTAMLAQASTPLTEGQPSQPSTPPGQAERPSCGEHKSVTELIDRQFGEKREAVAVTSTGTMLEVFVSQKGAWTMLVSTPQGMSCIVGTGEGWDGNLAKFDLNDV